MKRLGAFLLGAAAVGMAAGAASAEPLKIGILESLSGPQTSTGRLFATASRYVFEKANAEGGYNGVPIEIYEYDNGGTTSGATSKFKQAVADGVHVVIQGASSAVGGQITEDVRKHNLRNPGEEVLYLNLGAEALELRGEKCHFHAFHFTTTAPMRVGSLVRVMKEEGHLGDRIYSINQNYSWGRDMEAAVEAYAETGGYEVVDSVLHEVNRIQDFSPFVARVKSADPDTVITGNWSNDLLLLMKAVGDSGLDVRFGTAFLDQVGNVANAGDVALGHYIAHSGNVALSTEEFAEDYRSATGHYPVYVEPGAVNGISMFVKALRSVDFGGGEIDTNEIALALENTTLGTDTGAMSIREADHQTVMPVVVSRVERGAEYPVDDTDMGFAPVKVVAAEDAIYPAQDSCRMRRPES